MKNSRPTICITLGDPAGVGPEVAVKALGDGPLRDSARWVLVGEAWQVEQVGRPLGLAVDQVVTQLADARDDASVVVLDARQVRPDEFAVGQVSAACGRASLDYVRRAAEFCLAGTASAIVTGPLSKEAVAKSGVPNFCGHTEYLAELCGADESRLFLFHEKLSVVHVSTHCSLVEATRLSTERICRTIEMGHAAMVRMTGREPRVAVCGLNPHAGENGLFGGEETEFILPAVEQARSAGIDCAGPLPADALFMQAVRGKYDLVVAMYHDQGHVPMKMFDFEHTVNVTLGLPIIRTSVDHGTAFDIAGRGEASAVDMQCAMQLALRLSNEA
jgi:4-hydroxythreonine-4-phosphate dehydrogenase